MAQSDLLIVVPARGGSKGLPGKNVRLLGGRPLIAWTLETVRAAGLEARCVLSTDDEGIAKVGRELGFPVPFMRPPELATDTASSVDVALHAIDWAEKAWGPVRRLVLLQPTSPLRPKGMIERGLAMLDDEVDAVIGVKPLHRSPSLLFIADEKKNLTPLEQGPAQTLRQATRALYTPNGAFYAVRAQVLRAERTFYPRRMRALELDAICSIDIDDETDFQLAEAVANRNRGA
jgi:N-acylneuraminate cytidylyltransferase/CMP-N,N'-diacetyllegionaminic acid synthase